MAKLFFHGPLVGLPRVAEVDFAAKAMAELERRCSASEDPDSALGRFHDFLAGLTVGVRCLSLLVANPVLLELLSEITMTAPALAGTLRHAPEQLQAASLIERHPSGTTFAIRSTRRTTPLPFMLPRPPSDMGKPL